MQILRDSKLVVYDVLSTEHFRQQLSAAPFDYSKRKVQNRQTNLKRGSKTAMTKAITKAKKDKDQRQMVKAVHKAKKDNDEELASALQQALDESTCDIAAVKLALRGGLPDNVFEDDEGDLDTLFTAPGNGSAMPPPQVLPPPQTPASRKRERSTRGASTPSTAMSALGRGMDATTLTPSSPTVQAQSSRAARREGLRQLQAQQYEEVPEEDSEEDGEEVPGEYGEHYEKAVSPSKLAKLNNSSKRS